MYGHRVARISLVPFGKAGTWAIKNLSILVTIHFQKPPANQKHVRTSKTRIFLCNTGFRLTLTHWVRVTHICVDNLTIIGSDNGLSPGRRQAIIWTNVGILLVEPLGTNFSEILIEVITFQSKMHFKMSSGNWRPLCLGLNELRVCAHSEEGNKTRVIHLDII